MTLKQIRNEQSKSLHNQDIRFNKVIKNNQFFKDWLFSLINMIIVRFVNVTMSGNSRRFIVEFNNKLENAKNPFIEEGNHFKMVKNRNGYGVGPLPTIQEFTDYSRPWEINLYWIDRTKSINIAKKHTYDILRNYIGYSEDIVQKAMEVAEIKQTEYAKITPDYEPPITFEVKIQMDLK